MGGIPSKICERWESSVVGIVVVGIFGCRNRRRRRNRKRRALRERVQKFKLPQASEYFSLGRDLSLSRILWPGHSTSACWQARSLPLSRKLLFLLACDGLSGALTKSGNRLRYIVNAFHLRGVLGASFGAPMDRNIPSATVAGLPSSDLSYFGFPAHQFLNRSWWREHTRDDKSDGIRGI